MLSSLRKDFTGRARHQPFDAAITFKPRGLVFGIGTVLVPFARDTRVSLDADAAANDRLVALLAVAGRGRLPAGCVTQVGKALDEWSRGDKALAAIRLAFARLPGVGDWDEAYALFLAETLLDEGLPPRDLLAGLGTLAAVAPLLKDRPDQPRVPAGNGRASGEYGSTGGTAATAPSERPGQAATPAVPAASQSSEASMIPVFLDTRHQHETKPPPLITPESPSEAIHEGRPFDGFLPLGGLPVPLPVPAPDSATSAGGDDKDGPACPDERKDVPHRFSQAVIDYENLVHRLTNPEDPTKEGYAYFLPNPNTGGETSFDDCKKANTPSAIPGIRRGDMVDAKNERMLSQPWITGIKKLEGQFKSQQDAVVADGKGRQVFVCFDGARAAEAAEEMYGEKFNRLRFLDCR